MGFFTEKKINVSLLEAILEKETQVQNPVLGYYAQYCLKRVLKKFSPERLNDFKDDGDFRIEIGAVKYIVECKLASSRRPRGCGLVQMQSSNCREVVDKNGVKRRTTKYLVGTFDVLAVCTFPIYGEWEFLFCGASNLKQDGKGFWKTIQVVDSNWNKDIRKVI